MSVLLGPVLFNLFPNILEEEENNVLMKFAIAIKLEGGANAIEEREIIQRYFCFYFLSNKMKFMWKSQGPVLANISSLGREWSSLRCNIAVKGEHLGRSDMRKGCGQEEMDSLATTSAALRSNADTRQLTAVH